MIAKNSTQVEAIKKIEEHAEPSSETLNKAKVKARWWMGIEPMLR